MAIQIPGEPDQILKSIFPHSERFETGGGKERPGQATVVVAQDDTGDTDDIQEAINLLPPEGGEVFIKEGTYLIKERIFIDKENVKLSGTGRASIITSVTDLDIIFINAVDNIIIRDFKIIGDITKSGQSGIRIQNSQHTTIENVFFLDCGNHGIEATAGCLQLYLLNNEISNAQESGINSVTCDDTVISSNRIRGCEGSGMLFTNCSKNIITGNSLLGNGDAVTDHGLNFTASCDQNIISNNSINSSSGYGIEIGNANCDENIIIGNIFNANVTGTVNDIGTNTHPNGTSGTNNLALDDLNILS